MAIDTVQEVLEDYTNADFPGYPESNPFVDRLIALGYASDEAVDELTTCWLIYPGPGYCSG